MKADRVRLAGASPGAEALASPGRAFHDAAILGQGNRRAVPMSFFSFPGDARWNAGSEAVEFSVSIGRYQGIARVPRRVFQRLLSGSATPEKCLEAYHLNRTRIERAVEAKLRRRQLSEDGNVELTGSDLTPGDPARMQR